MEASKPLDYLYKAILVEMPRHGLERLVNAGYPWNIITQHGDTLLHIAASNGHSPAVHYFASIGADVNAKNIDGYTPMFCAAIKANKNFLKIVDALVAHGADLMELGPKGENLLMAAVSGHQSLSDLQVLVERGLQFDILDEDSLSILNYAIADDNVDALTYFVELGADIKHRSHEGMNLLHWAAYFSKQNFRKILTFLCEKGLEIQEVTPWGSNLLMIAIERSEYHSIEDVKWLVHQGLRFDICDSDGDNILCCAVRSTNLEALRYFVSKGVDPSHKNKNGDTPFTIAKSYFAEDPQLMNKMREILKPEEQKSETTSSARESPQMGPSGRKSFANASLPRTSLTRKSFSNESRIELKWKEDWIVQNDKKEVEELTKALEQISLSEEVQLRKLYVANWMEKAETMPSFSSLK